MDYLSTDYSDCGSIHRRLGEKAQEFNLGTVEFFGQF